jgi:hypothetical protein
MTSVVDSIMGISNPVLVDSDNEWCMLRNKI